MVNAPEVCRYRGYGADAESEHNDYRKWQVLAARLTFVIVFEVYLHQALKVPIQLLSLYGKMYIVCTTQ
jgi:hypothetical protein